MNRLLLLVLRIYARGIRQSWEEILDKWETGSRRVVRAIVTLKPIEAINAVLDLVTGWGVIVLAIPDRGLETFVLERAHELRVHNRLMTVQAAIRGIYDAQVALIGAVTFTGPDSLQSLIVSGTARFFWRLVKHVKLLRALLRVGSEAELVQVFIDSWLGKLKLLRAVGFAVAVLLIFVKLGTICLTISWLWSFEAFRQRILPQDARRVRVRIHVSGIGSASSQKRLNAGPGPDTRDT